MVGGGMMPLTYLKFELVAKSSGPALRIRYAETRYPIQVKGSA